MRFQGCLSSIALLFFIVFPQPLSAQKTWDGGAGNSDWSAAANWNPDGVPTSSDDVIIDANVEVNISGTTQAEALTLTLGGTVAGAKLTISGEATLRIYQDTDVSLILYANSTLTISNENEIGFGSIGGYDQSLTFFADNSTVNYQRGNVQVDTYAELVIYPSSGITVGTTGNGTIFVNGLLIKYGDGNFFASDSIVGNSDFTINQSGSAIFDAGFLSHASLFRLANGTVGGRVTFKGQTIRFESGSCTGTIKFAGSAIQYITYYNPTGPYGSFQNLTMNNISILQLDFPIRVNGNLHLMNGLINSASNLITLGPGATVSGGSDNSFIYGPCARIVSPGVDEIYPVGDTYYRPVIANLSGSEPVVSFEVFDLSPVPNFVDPLRVLSRVRYWYGSIDSGAVSGGTVTLTYGADDGVQVPGDVRVAYSRDEGQWAYRNISGDTGGSSGQVTGTLPADSLGYFTLGSVTFDNSLPVRVVSFTARGERDRIVLQWETVSEVNNAGFEIYRSEGESGEYRRLNGELIMGKGNSHQLERYEYADKEVEAGAAYYYRLYSQDFDGTRHEYGEVVWAEVRGIPGGFQLRPTYPNPFNPVTRISFSVGSESVVSVEVYDVVGRRVRVIMDEERMVAGEYDGMMWDGRDDGGEAVANGIYYLVFTVREQGIRQVQKMVFMK